MSKGFNTVGFIGAGRTASALAVGITKAGYAVVAVASRSEASAKALAGKIPGCQAVANASDVVQKCDVVFLTVPDDAIGTVATALPWRKGQGVVHCSGALSAEALAPAQRRGAMTGGLHPLQTFGSRDAGERLLAGSTFAVEGDGDLDQWLRETVHRLGGHDISILPEDRALYHAAAVMGCGYIATLLHASTALWKAMGFSEEEALRAMLPLTRGTLDTVEARGTRDGATGPILRGDTGTVRRHLKALVERTPEALPLYCQIGLAMVALAEERGSIGLEQAREMRTLIGSYLKRVEAVPAMQGAASRGKIK